MRFALLAAAVLAGLTAFAPGADAAPTRIYLLRGFANVFSTGLDTLAGELSARGFNVEVRNHVDASDLAVEAARRQRADKGNVIIIGHSLGADAAVGMAQEMKQSGGTVLLLVTFGPDYQQAVPPNVSHVLNYYQGGDILTKGPGFKGTLTNVNLDQSAGINHFNVEKIEGLHAKVIARIRALTAPRPAAPAPVAAPAQAAAAKSTSNVR